MGVPILKVEIYVILKIFVDIPIEKNGFVLENYFFDGILYISVDKK